MKFQWHFLPPYSGSASTPLTQIKRQSQKKKKEEATRVRDAVAMSLLQCHTQERANVTLYQAPVCASCMTGKAELVYSHVLKGLDSDLRPFPSSYLSVINSALTSESVGIHFRCFLSRSLLFCLAVSSHLFISLHTSFDLPVFPYCTSLSMYLI